MNAQINVNKLCESGKRVIELELAEIKNLLHRVDINFATACKLILTSTGRVIVTGMGKSGHIARKFAATLASTGTPAIFMHPAEASHGDIGIITKDDVVIAISNSGTTSEILTILPVIKRKGVQFITLTGNKNSTLALEADVNLDISVKQEACSLNLAPTASTTVALVLTDAIAIALLEARGFTKEDFAFSHPAGHLGKKLLLRIKDIMHVNNEIPKVFATATLKETLFEMTKKSLGMTAIINKQNKVLGIFTDGDLRRALDNNFDINKTLIKNLMTKNCITIDENILATEALKIMQDKKINGILITDKNNLLIGALNLLDLIKQEVV